MLTVKDIKKILDKNNIKYNSYGDKEYYLELLTEHGISPYKKIPTVEDPIKPEKIPMVEGPIKLEYEREPVPDPKYERLKTIKKNPRKVILEDVQTGEIHEFPSIYKASKFIDRCPQTILNWEDRVWKNKYMIKVL